MEAAGVLAQVFVDLRTGTVLAMSLQNGGSRYVKVGTCRHIGKYIVWFGCEYDGAKRVNE